MKAITTQIIIEKIEASKKVYEDKFASIPQRSRGSQLANEYLGRVIAYGEAIKIIKEVEN